MREPEVFLFDEPLSNLDAMLRVATRIEIGKLHDDLKATMIYVTHDQVEAMTMADKIVVLNAGIIEQVGSPLDLYNKPDNMFVAGFIGSPKMNFIKGELAGETKGAATVELPGGAKINVPLKGKATPNSKAVTLGIRPEHLTLDNKGDAKLGAKIRIAEHLGSESLFYAEIAGGSELTVRTDGMASRKAGETVDIMLSSGACHLFDANGKAFVNGALAA